MMDRYTAALRRPELRVTALAIFVVVLWGMLPWLRALAGEVPALQLTAMAMGCAAVSSRLLPGSDSLRSALRAHPPQAWLVIVGGMLGALTLYFAALSLAPAPQVVVIAYTWPLLLALAGDLYRRRPPSFVSILALLLGLAGVAILQGGGASLAGRVGLGCVAALGAGLCWAGYSLFVQVYARPVGSAYPAFFALAAVVALLLQAATQGLVWPLSPAALAAAAALGVGPYGLAFMAWAHVLQHGNPRVVPVLPYAVPGVAAAILVLTDHVEPTLRLALGCGVVALACVTAMRGNTGQRAPRLRPRS
ncbi:hypothetical protein SAOR_15440 [Salinisphaera orenii MK-B5]|uniref:EamA domain-containing protein n=1 Tax=Salinisphaera orenii MK-B5 TaxID=856730 RepID=A0A423PFL5_9GAMM|nr:hypothetical protein SAOR_15440 [Salinisphaera orenii MK-B5]